MYAFSVCVATSDQTESVLIIRKGVCILFTQVEENYLKSLINTYKKQGYDYYLCHTVTETDNNYDIYLYVSKEEIKAVSTTRFDLTNAISIKIDSSSRNDNSYNPSTHSRDYIENNNLTTSLEINQAEFIYTNAICSYETTSGCLNPDLLLQGTDSISSLYLSIVCVVVLVITFLYTFFANILRIRK